MQSRVCQVHRLHCIKRIWMILNAYAQILDPRKWRNSYDTVRLLTPDPGLTSRSPLSNVS